MFGFKNKKELDEVIQQNTSSVAKKTSWRQFLLKVGLVVIGIYLLVCVGIGFYWSSEPEMFSVEENAQQIATQLGIADKKLPVGFVTTETLKRVASTIINKRGGYLSNDMFPPGIWLDNIPNWEMGVLRQVRDMTQSLQRGFSRSQSQSAENANLLKAFESFNTETNRWLFPATEERYQKGIDFLTAYEKQLINPNDANGKFYPRADNLAGWLALVESQLGALSQKLSASVGQERIELDIIDKTDNTLPKEKINKTPWLQIDDVFYEARGQTWALVHFLRAIEVDFHDVLEKKNALISFRQIIRELEATQQSIWSPIILNGSGFGFLANHSLVMANYISRANAAIIDLRRLLEQG